MPVRIGGPGRSRPNWRIQPTSLAVTPSAPRALAPYAPAAVALALAADARSVRQHTAQRLMVEAAT